MRKLYTHLLFLLFYLVFSLLGFSQSTQDTYKATFQKGKVMVKVKQDSQNGRISPHFAAERFKSIGIIQTEQPFEKYAQTEINKSGVFLNTFYEVSFSPDIPVKEMIQQLSQYDWVEYAEPIQEYEFLAPYIPNDPLLGNQSGLSRSLFSQAWGISKGDTSTVIGIIDTGINYNHPDLKNKVKYNHKERYGRKNIDDDLNGYVDDSLGYDFGFMDNNVIDGHYHGTFVSGVAGAQTDNSVGIAGAGFNCKVLPIKVLSPAGTIVNLYPAILYAAHNGCKVINLSLGSAGDYLRWEEEIIRYVTLDKDVSVVAAAGNTNKELDFYPASYQYVTSVAFSTAGDAKDNLATYSTYVDVVAQGRNIYSTKNSGYAFDSGSSFASPLVAGAIGLVRSAFPHLNAIQAAELVRVCSDTSFYAVGSNKNFKEKLGYGRLNALRPLQEEHTAKAARVVSFTYENRYGQYASPNDTLIIRTNIKNYLAATAQNFKIQLSSSSPYLKMIDSVAFLGTMETLAQKDSITFRVKVAADIPRDASIKVRFGFSDSTYRDYQYWAITPINASYLDVNYNNLSLTITNNGRIGYLDANYRKGIGITYKNASFLSEAGLMIGQRRSADSVVVSDGLISMPTLSQVDKDFKPVYTYGIPNPSFVEKSELLTQVTTTFTDTTQNTQKIGVIIHQNVIGKRNSPDENFVILRYDIVNVSNKTFDSLNVAFYADWDLGNGLNYCLWDEIFDFGYTYKGSSYAGVKLLEKTKHNFYALDLKNVGGSNLYINDGFTNKEKYQAISSGVKRTQAGFEGAGNDVAQVVGTTIFNLAAQDTTTVYFALLGGNTLGDIRTAAQQAEYFVNPPSISPIPILQDSLFCAENTPYILKGINGTKFRLFNAQNPVIPIREGNNFEMRAVDTAQVFLMTCIDSVLESAPIRIQFGIHNAKAAFYATDYFNLSDSTYLHLYDQSINPIAWTWEMGDGKVYTERRQLTHRYNAQGVYTVKLSITDSMNCQNTITKVITVARRSPKPIVPESIKLCWDDSVTIQPKGGTLFRFYFDEELENLVYEGNNYTMKSNTIRRVYITCVDSMLESLTSTVSLSRNYIKVDFSAKIISVRDAEIGLIHFTNLSESKYSIVSYAWDFGDSTPLSTNKNTSHVYKKEGIYIVTLTVKDFSGCVASISKEVRVGKKSPIPLLNWGEKVEICASKGIEISATNASKLKFFADEQRTQLLHKGKKYNVVASPLMPNALWVVNEDSIVESDAAKINLVKASAFADFEFTRELFLYEKNSVQFVDMSQEAIQWEWNFGNGQTSTLKNPQAYYDKQGAYLVSLKIVDKKGCESSITKTLKVYNRSAKPNMGSLHACAGDRVVLQPQNGTKFRFYNSVFASKPIFEGRIYITPILQNATSYYITCVDSTIESLATKVDILLSKPQADFKFEKDTLNLFHSSIMKMEDQSRNANFLHWDFGNGEVSRVKNPSVVFTKKGTYTVRLIAGDSLGCLDSVYRDLIVIDAPIIEDFSPEKGYAFKVYPNPIEESQILNIVLNVAKPQKTEIFIIDATGKKVVQIPAEEVMHKKYELKLEALPKGLYFLYIVLPNKLIQHKVVVL